jgi:uncharacterized membrane protein YfcA|nr:sulfite exporter TauE/SafE family protein [Tabrizicola soli]
MEYSHLVFDQSIYVFIIVAMAGFVRGITGFGGAMFMAPPLSLILSPVVAVIYALALEAAAAVVMFPSIRRHLEYRTLALLGVPAVVSIPIGGLLLVNLDSETIRVALSLTVMLFSLLLIFGLRYSGSPRASTATAVGALSGLLFGATSMGGPPVILYLLSGPAPHWVTRANLVAYISFTSGLSLLLPWYLGYIPVSLALDVAIAIPPYFAGIFAGLRIFPLLNDKFFRRFTLIFIFLVAGFALIV